MSARARCRSGARGGTVWVNCWLHRELHMPFGGMKASGVAREGGDASLDFTRRRRRSASSSRARAAADAAGSARRALPAALAASRPVAARRRRAPAVRSTRQRRPSASVPPAAAAAGADGASAFWQPLSTAAAVAPAADADDGHVATAPAARRVRPHARRAGELLFLAGLGPRDPATNTVPGGPIEDADGARLDATRRRRRGRASPTSARCSRRTISRSTTLST